MIPKKLKFKIFILIMFVVFMIGAVSVLAAEVDYKPAFPWEGAEGISGMVQKFYTMALAAVGVAALGALIYGAILWTVSEAVSSKQEAMEWIKGALLGLVLLLGAVLLLQTINPELVKLKEPGLPKPAAMPSNQSGYAPGYSKIGETSNTITMFWGNNYRSREQCENSAKLAFKDKFIGVIYDTSQRCEVIYKK